MTKAIAKRVRNEGKGMSDAMNPSNLSRAPSDESSDSLDSAPPRVSVLMPVYNGEQYLEEAADSILAQTFRDFEFLIMNDGSTDRTGEHLDRLAARDDRIRVFHRKNRGIIDTLNEMLQLARAPLIARMDADDVALPERFARQVRYLDEHPECVSVGTDIMLIDPDGHDIVARTFPTTHEEIDQALLLGATPYCHPATMFRRETVLEIGGYHDDCLHAEDLDLFLRLGEVGRLGNLPDPLFKHREHFGMVGVKHARIQGESTRRILLEAHERRGLTPPESVRRLVFDPLPPAEKHRNWSRWALAVGNVATARKHALAAFRLQPFSRSTWKVLIGCAVSGTKIGNRLVASRLANP